MLITRLQVHRSVNAVAYHRQNILRMACSLGTSWSLLSFKSNSKPKTVKYELYIRYRTVTSPCSACIIISRVCPYSRTDANYWRCAGSRTFSKRWWFVMKFHSMKVASRDSSPLNERKQLHDHFIQTQSKLFNFLINHPLDLSH